LGTLGWSQENGEERQAYLPSKQLSQQRSEEQLKVNFIYGAYIPKEAPLVSLTGHQRAHLFVLQTFTTPGIYVKTPFLALMNQASGAPYEWGGGLEGFGRRAASSYARSSIQNVVSTVGNAALQYEPRYDRCRCTGFGPRTKHVLMRNSVTYNKTERNCVLSLRSTELRLGLGCCPASGSRMASFGRMASAVLRLKLG
jgi:hypothetical protein